MLIISSSLAKRIATAMAIPYVGTGLPANQRHDADE